MCSAPDLNVRRKISIPSGPDETETIRGMAEKNLCADCKREGHTPEDVSRYVCDGEKCECKGGVLKFPEESITRHKKAGKRSPENVTECAKQTKLPKK